LGKGKLIWKQACPTWASANLFTGKLAQAGQGRICFTSQLPKLGKNKFKKNDACVSCASDEIELLV